MQSYAYGQVLRRWYPLPRKYLFDDIVGKVYQSYRYVREVNSNRFLCSSPCTCRDHASCNIAATHQLALMWMVYALATLLDVNKAPYAVEAHEYYLLSRLALRYAPPAHDTTLIAIQTMVSCYLLKVSPKM